ncbi:MAG: FTR1 family protein, partial [Actinobacteria bacterium]|nr:FTR1 family protein [Actinomycetota bacterium]
MIESLVITLREGIEAALVVGIILTYLNKVGKTTLKKMVYLGLAISIIASIAFAIVFQMLNLDPENEYLEGSLLIAASIMVATLVIWMWRVSKSIKTEVEKKLDSIVNQKNTSAQGLGLMAFTFLMVFREGAETVLF